MKIFLLTGFICSIALCCEAVFGVPDIVNQGLARFLPGFDWDMQAQVTHLSFAFVGVCVILAVAGPPLLLRQWASAPPSE